MGLHSCDSVYAQWDSDLTLTELLRLNNLLMPLAHLFIMANESWLSWLAGFALGPIFAKPLDNCMVSLWSIIELPMAASSVVDSLLSIDVRWDVEQLELGKQLVWKIVWRCYNYAVIYSWFEISAPPAPPSQLSYDECTFSVKMRRRWKGLATLPYVSRLRKWSCLHLVPMAF